MSNSGKILGVTALAVGIVVAFSALGHGYGSWNGMGMHGFRGGGYGPGHHMMNFDGMPHGGMVYGENIEQRLDTLKNSLQITNEQQPVWDQYEKAVKTSVENGGWGHMKDWNGDLESHYATMQQHFTQMKAVFDARKTLYDNLTEQQKEIFNNNMHGPYGHHFGYNR